MSWQLINYGGHYLSQKRNIFVLVILSLIFLLTLFSGCTDTRAGVYGNKDDVLIVACTIPPQEEFIKAIGGDKVRVLVMVPPGASPHTFEPLPSQITGLENADVYISLGSGLEFENRWLSRIREMYPAVRIVNTSENISFLNGEEQVHGEGETKEELQEAGYGKDPHVWLSIKNAAKIVNTTCEALSSVKPMQRDTFEKNRDDYLVKLSKLDNRINNALAPLPSRKVLVYHPAFGYFCNDYNLTQISVEEGGHEPSAKGLAALVDEARAEKIKIVFSEPEFSTRGAEKLAQEINGTMVLISPLSAEYLKNMELIADRISGL